MPFVSAIVLALLGGDGRAAPAAVVPAWDPQLVVSGFGQSTYRITLWDRAKWRLQVAVETERWVVYVPRGFSIDTTLLPGTVIGDSYGQRGGVLGEVVVADSAVGSSRDCSEGSHDALWRLPTDSDEFPAVDRNVVVAVDRVVNGAEALVAAYGLTICSPRTDGDSALDFSIDVISPPTSPGAYVWRAIFYPTSYRGARIPQPVEGRSLVRLPIRVALSAKRFVATVGTPPTRQRKVSIAGVVTEQGRPPVQEKAGDAGHYYVSLYRRTERASRDQYLGDLPVTAAGRFGVAVRDRRGSYYRVVTIFESAFPLGRRAPSGLCARPWLAAGGCVRPNLWEFTAESPIVRAR